MLLGRRNTRMSSLASVSLPQRGAARIQRAVSWDSLRRLRDTDALILVGLFVWFAVGIAIALRPMLRSGGIFTGVTTANPDDSFQYLAWVRDSGLHGLIGDNFQLGPSHYDFLQPMFLISGLLWRVGLSLPLSYLIWAPVAAVFSWWSFRRLVRHHLSGWGAPTAIVLGLAYMTPISLWALGHAGHSLGQVTAVASEMTSVTALWGYLPRMIAVACLPVLLLSLEAILDAERPNTAPVLVAAGASAIASWLHPWQGGIALFILVGGAIWSRSSWRQLRLLAMPALAAALPLLYYAALEHFDPNWASGGAQNTIPAYSWLADAACLLPLIAVALLGVRRSLAISTSRRLLLLWLAASLVGYFATSVYSVHMLNGVTLPLAILAVDGVNSARGRRIRSHLSPSRATSRILAGIAILAVTLSTVPGLYLFAQSVWSAGSGEASGLAFTSQDARALAYLEHDRTPGGVLASPSIASAVPALTGRHVWAGHFVWTPDFVTKMEATYLAFTGARGSAWTRELVVASGARFVLIDCFTNRNSSVAGGISPEARMLAALRGDIVGHRDFGCASVLELNNARSPA